MTRLRQRRTFVRMALASGAGDAASVPDARGAQASGEPLPDAATLEPPLQPRPYSPYADRSFPTNVYWGDTHLHTGFLLDAGAWSGGRRPDAPKATWRLLRLRDPDAVVDGL